MKFFARLGVGCIIAANFLPLTALAATTTPHAAPPTCSMQVTPSSINVGGSVTLKWASTDATGGTITGVGSVAPQGQINLLPSSASQTVFVGTFVGPGGSAQCSATVSVS